MSPTAVVTVLTLLLTVFFLIYKYITKDFGYWKSRNIAFVPPTVPFGNFKNVVFGKQNIGQYLETIYESSKEDMIGMWIFGSPQLVIRSPEIIKHILLKDFNHFYDRTIISDERADPISSKMLLTIKNPEWKILRQATLPVFTISKLKNMFPLVTQCINDMMVYMKKNSGVMNARELSSKYMTNVITSVGFGVDAYCFEQEDAAFRVAGRQMLSPSTMNSLRAICYFLVPSLVKLLRISFFDLSAIDFLRKAVWDTIHAREKSGAQRNDFIDILVQMRKSNNFPEGVKFEGDMVVAQAVAFFSAGFETSSATISFTFYELALNKTIQNRLREELKLVHEKYGGFTYEALSDAPYLEQVFAETLRKYPILPFLDRRCNEEYKVPDTDIIIEKGTPVFISLLGLHYDPEYYPNPTVYDPDRFTEENINQRPKYAYMPFGQGHRNCIGERSGTITTKLCIAQLIFEYEIERCARTPVPLILSTKSFVLQPIEELYLKFIKL